MTNIQILTHIFIIYCTILMGVLFTKWSNKEPLIKLSMLLIVILGLVIELKSFQIL
jgi:hypothetical protein